MSSGSPTNRVGEFVGSKYQIVRRLAEGGMGVVYEAEHVVIKRRFAVKFLHANLADRRDVLSRFRREAEAAGALESEHIAAAVDFGIVPDGTPYIVMEYLAGESLGALLAREGRLPVGRATDLCVQACRGIAAAHAAGIIHRDLKPENLFVCGREDGTDRIKILDFGIAKLVSLAVAGSTTRSGAVLGTPAYMSPEQARGEPTLDHRTDLYALGAVLFEMLSGEKLHPGDCPPADLATHSHGGPDGSAAAPASRLGAVQPSLPVELVETVARALAHEPMRRHDSADGLARELAPFARRSVWPRTFQVPSSTAEVSTAPGPTISRAAGTADPALAELRRRTTGRWRSVTTIGAVLAAAIGVAGLFGISGLRHSVKALPRRLGNRTLPRDARFFVPSPRPGAIQQIAALIQQRAFADAARLTAMSATPQAVWFVGGTPEDVRSAVQNTVIRAAPDHRVPVLVANNIPFRDCAQYSAGGASNTAAYQAWIDGFATGIGNARTVVILEPDSLGIIPYSATMAGAADWCKPIAPDTNGNPVAAPGANPPERYAQLNYAVDSLAANAPNSAIYLDGTHSGWLGVGEIAFRLVKAGVRRAQGFFVNVASFQATPQSIQYATWIAKCIYYANHPAAGDEPRRRYESCASQYSPAAVDDFSTWSLTERWYLDNVDRAKDPPSRPGALTHFVIDTSRNGRGPLDLTRFQAAPYDQPAEVLRGLARGNWCNPPGAGLGPRPTADTHVTLADAFLWVKLPGGSDGSCDVAGGARAWDYARYNPWGIRGDSQQHFDPLWGMVAPAAGEWFAEQALQLAQSANPPLEDREPPPPTADDGRGDTSAGGRN